MTLSRDESSTSTRDSDFGISDRQLEELHESHLADNGSRRYSGFQICDDDDIEDEEGESADNARVHRLTIATACGDSPRDSQFGISDEQLKTLHSKQDRHTDGLAPSGDDTNQVWHRVASSFSECSHKSDSHFGLADGHLNR